MSVTPPSPHLCIASPSASRPAQSYRLAIAFSLFSLSSLFGLFFFVSVASGASDYSFFGRVLSEGRPVPGAMVTFAILGDAFLKLLGLGNTTWRGITYPHRRREERRIAERTAAHAG